MAKAIMHKIRTLVLLVCLATVEMTVACEFHDRFGSWAAVGSSHHGLSSRINGSRASAIQLKTPSVVTATRDTELHIPVSFSYELLDNPGIELSIELDEESMSTDVTVVNLQDAVGKHTFEVIPRAAGMYRVKVVARTLANTGANAAIRRSTIYVKVTD